MRDEAPGTEETSQFKAFVGGLSYQITDADLKAAFDRYDCSSAKIMTEKFTGRPRGFGFVWFKDEAGMKEAIEQMHNKELEGRRISVVKAVPENQTSPGTPAAMLGAGNGSRRDYGRRDRGYGGDRGYGDRGGYGGGYDRGGYDRGGYDRGGYDRGGYGGYDRGGYDRAAYGGYGGAYGGYGDYRGYGGYGGYGTYDDRTGGYGGSYGYDRGYDDRGAGGPDRRGYTSSARSAPYGERPERRSAEPGPRR